MHAPRSLIRSVFVAFSLLIVLGSTAAAQPAGYISGAAFADIRQFGGNQTVLPAGGSVEESFDTTGVGGGLRIGTFLHPRWSLELGVDASSRETVTFQDPFVILIFPPVPPRERKSTSQFMNVSTTVGFHPAAMGRVRLGYRAGFSFMRATYESDNSVYALAGIESFVWASGDLGSPVLPRQVAPTSLYRSATFIQKHNAGALTLGFEAAIDLAARLAIVPEVRAYAFSSPGIGATVFLIRPGVGVRWKF
jgi:hypothetical protein